MKILPDVEHSTPGKYLTAHNRESGTCERGKFSCNVRQDLIQLLNIEDLGEKEI